MPVSNETWARGMLELALLPSREEDQAMETLRGDVYRRELQPFLTDHEWTHAVSEALRGGQWFPTIYELADHAKRAPAPPVPQTAGLLTGSFGCDLCEGTGFEPFTRGGYAFVRHCPRGCKPYRPEDGPRGDSRVESWSAKSSPAEFGGTHSRPIPFPDAKGIEERLKAICREKTAQGIEGFRYVGIEADMPEPVSADEWWKR